MTNDEALEFANRRMKLVTAGGSYNPDERDFLDCAIGALRQQPEDSKAWEALWADLQASKHIVQFVLISGPKFSCRYDILPWCPTTAVVSRSIYGPDPQAAVLAARNKLTEE